MRPRRMLPFVLAGALVLPAAGQEPDRTPVLQKLATRQKRAAQQLRGLLGQIQVLTEELRRRNEKEKAELLERAVAIVLQQKIPVSQVAGGSGRAEEVLGDLQRAMDQMARILEERPDATEEVQALGKNVVDTLEQVLHVLTGPEDIKSLEERENALKDARVELSEMARRQRELRRETQSAVPRTAAENAAQKGAKELAQLSETISDLDRRAQAELKEVDAARERAARLSDLLTRQQRLQQETAVRAGETDELTPRVNRALAELEAIARAARSAESAAAEKGALADSARELDALAARQEAVAREIAAREALERARDAADAQAAKAEIEKAAALAEGADAEALRAIARAFESDQAKARAALEANLSQGPSKETLARDEESVARDAEKALAGTPPVGEAALKEASAEAARAAEDLKGGRAAEGAARKAAEALRRAHEAVAAAAKETAAEQAFGPEKRSREAAERARALAAEMKGLAEDPKAKESGLSGAADAARAAAARAAAEMEAAAEAARKGEGGRAEEQARAAAERAEQAMRELSEGIRPGEDLAERQGLVADDLRNLADRPGEPEAAAMREAAENAGAARDGIRKGDHAAARKEQDDAIEKLGALVQKAEQQAREAAEKNAAALERAARATEAAASRADEIGKGLGEGARAARENDARRRLEDAAERTKEAAEALRRSLRRLQQGLPKSAEQDRQEAKERVDAARRSLGGLRESHANPSEQARERMQETAKRQGELEEQVKRLEQRLRKNEQKPGAERLQDAQAAMREARQQLEQGDPDEAERAQERAEEALEEAETDLDQEERRYRQLRQHELLYKLKEELKNFRRAAQGHREHLQLIEAEVRKAGRVTRPIRRGPLKELTDQVGALQRDVASKAGAVEEEGAVVYTYILKGCASDLQEVTAQLGLSEVGLVPQELLGDVVRRFDLAIKGLERDLQERREQQQQQGGGGPSPVQNKPALVPAEAEIRMTLVLQKALNEERENFFASRPGFGKDAPSESDKARLERMYHQQGSLAELFDSLSQSLFGPEDAHGPQEEGGPGPEGEGAGEAPGPEGGRGDGGREDDGAGEGGDEEGGR